MKYILLSQVRWPYRNLSTMERGNEMDERMKIFTDQELSRVHDLSMEILRDVGIAFLDPKAVEIFKKHGVRVDGKTVFLDENHVRKALQTTPSQFSITARNPKKSISIGAENVAIVPGYGAASIITSTGKKRAPIMEDYDKFCKLVQTSKQVNMNGVRMVEPVDVNSETAHLDMLLSNILLCDKPFICGSTSKQAAIDSLEMAGIVWGGKEGIRDKPVMLGVVGPTSPLRYSKEITDVIIELARYGQPLSIGAAIMAGSTGPLTLSGVIALQNAELLAGVVLTQLVNPGVPVVYGSASSITDMRFGSFSVGAPEFSMIQLSNVQMARYYGLPARGSGGVTDAHFPDMQAGMESAISLTVTILSGASLILYACGIMSSYLAMSYEKFVADEEICGMLRRILKPVDMSKASIALEMIKEVGIGGEYLTHPKTLELCRTEFFIPELMNRVDYETWNASDKKTLHEVAKDRVIQRLGAYERPKIDPEIEYDLIRYVKRMKKN